jgi:hypothetical protein
VADDRPATVDADRKATLVRYGSLVAIAAAVLEVLSTTLSEFASVGDAVELGDVVATYLLFGIAGVAAMYVRSEDEFERAGKLDWPRSPPAPSSAS